MRPIVLALVLVIPAAQDKLGADFVTELRDFNKSLEKANEKISQQKPAKDDLDELLRALKRIEGAATNEDERAVRSCAQWTTSLLVARAAMTSNKVKYTARWIAHYDRVIAALAESLVGSQKSKAWAGIKCGSACAKGLVECPACNGAGKCGARLGEYEGCHGGTFRLGTAMGPSISNVCVVCHGSTVCCYCDGTGKLLCPVEHRIAK